MEWLPRSSLARLVCARLFCTFRLPAPPSFFHLPAHARCHPPTLARNGGEKVRCGLCFNESRPYRSYLFVPQPTVQAINTHHNLTKESSRITLGRYLLLQAEPKKNVILSSAAIILRNYASKVR